MSEKARHLKNLVACYETLLDQAINAGNPRAAMMYLGFVEELRPQLAEEQAQRDPTIIRDEV